MELPEGYQMIFQQKLYKPEGNGMIYLKWDYSLTVGEETLQPRRGYPTSFSFRFDGEIKSFWGKQKLREFSTTKAALQQMVKELV